MNTTIAFIGAGNMGGSLIGGLIAKGYPADKLWATSPDAVRCEFLQDQYPGLQTSTDNLDACQTAQMIVLSIKPQIFKSVCQQLSTIVQQTKPIILSIAAGIRTNQIANWLAYPGQIIRAMPNTPALVGAGATGLFANPHCDAQSKTLAQSLFDTCGISVWVENEAHMDIVTALSASGPAYFFLMIEQLIEAATLLGLPRSIASQLANQTALGSAQLLLQSGLTPSQLRQQVTSPQGTTEKGIEALQAGGFQEAIHRAIEAASLRGRTLSDAFE